MHNPLHLGDTKEYFLLKILVMAIKFYLYLWEIQITTTYSGIHLQSLDYKFSSSMSTSGKSLPENLGLQIVFSYHYV